MCGSSQLVPTEVGMLGWDGACWGYRWEAVRNQLRQESLLFHKHVRHTGGSVVKKGRGPALPELTTSTGRQTEQGT